MEEFPCGCKIHFGRRGEVRGVEVCDKHDSEVFGEHKSLKQLSQDIVSCQHREKHAAPLAPPAEEKKE